MTKYTSLFFCGVCGLAMSLLLCGCVPALLIARSTTDEDLENEMEDKWEDDSWDVLDDDGNVKVHYWQVLDAEGEEVCTIDGVNAVEKVDALVEGDMDWEQAESVENKTPLYQYVFMQETTLLAGQDPDSEREYEEVMRFTVYEDTDVMEMTVLEELNEALSDSLVNLIGLEDILTIYAKAPSETVEALRNPTQFSE